MQTTLKDIADYMGLSVSAISKALRDEPDISDSTKESVLKAAKLLRYPLNKYSYKNSRAATSNSLQDSRDYIIVASSDMTSPLYSPLTTLLSQIFAEHDFLTLTQPFGNNIEDLFKFLKVSAVNSAKGIVILAPLSTVPDNDSDLQKVCQLIDTLQKEKHIPVVLFGNRLLDGVDSLIYNSCNAFKVLQDHLIELGHKSVAYIGDSYCSAGGNNFSTVMDRIDIHSVNIIETGVPEEVGYSCMNRLLERKPYPTAIIAGYDRIALGVYRAIFEHHYSVPQDFSVVGSDNSPLSAYLTPSLSSIGWDFDKISTITSSLLLDKIKTPDFSVTQHVQIENNIIYRESIGTAPASHLSPI